MKIPLLDSVPVLRAFVSGHTVLDWAAVVAVLGSFYMMFRTRLGLRMRASGFDAATVASSGISVRRVRFVAIACCSVLCGLGGAFLSLGYLQVFGENMSAGRGWIALAAIVVVRGHPLGIAGVCAAFGVAGSLALKAQSIRIPPQFSEMLPYVATLGALYLYSKRPSSARSMSRLVVK